jgi:RimJ/RimL family protein N-acetyltransferase
LLPAYQGMGIIHEVLPIVIKYGFETMKLNSIEGEVDPDNFKSIKLMKKTDFTFRKKLINKEIYTVQNPNIKKKTASHQNKFLFTTHFVNLNQKFWLKVV